MRLRSRLLIPSMVQIGIVLNLYALASLFISLAKLSPLYAGPIIVIPATIHYWWDAAIFEEVRLPFWISVPLTIATYLLLFVGVRAIGLPNSIRVWAPVHLGLDAVAIAIVRRVGRKFGTTPTSQYPTVSAQDLQSAGIDVPSPQATKKPPETDRYLQRLAQADAHTVASYIPQTPEGYTLYDRMISFPIRLLRPFVRPFSLVASQRRFRTMEASMYDWSSILLLWAAFAAFASGTSPGYLYFSIGDVLLGVMISYVIVFSVQANAGVPPVALSPFLIVMAGTYLLRLIQGSMLPALCLFGAFAGDSLAFGTEVGDAEEFKKRSTFRPLAGVGLLGVLILVGLLFRQWFGSWITRGTSRAFCGVTLAIIVLGVLFVNLSAKKGAGRSVGLLALLAGVSYLSVVIVCASARTLTTSELVSLYLGLCSGYSGSVITNISTVRVTAGVGWRNVGRIAEQLQLVELTGIHVIIVGCAASIYILQLKASLWLMLVAISGMCMFAYRLLPWMYACGFIMSYSLRNALGKSRSRVLTCVRRVQALIVPLPFVTRAIIDATTFQGVARALGDLAAYQSVAVERTTLVRALRALGTPANARTVLEWALANGLVPELLIAGHRRNALRSSVRILCVLGALETDPYLKRSAIRIRSKGKRYDIAATDVPSHQELLSKAKCDLQDDEQPPRSESSALQILIDDLEALTTAEDVGQLLIAIRDITAAVEDGGQFDSVALQLLNRQTADGLRVLCADLNRGKRPLERQEWSWLYDSISASEQSSTRARGSLNCLLLSFSMQRLRDFMR